MPKFLDQQQIYRIIQRELPEGVYPDGAPDKFYSTADSDSTSKVFATAYANLERVYANFFPQSADEKQTDFEILYFGKLLDSALNLQQRRDRVLQKIRTRRRCTPSDLKAAVYTVIDSSIPVDIVEWGCSGGGWILDESQLDISTILNGYNRLDVTGDSIPCPPTAAAFGLSESQFAEMQEEAYTYEVRIYGTTLTFEQREDLDKVLLNAEPVRSRHIISDGLDPADQIGGDT